MRHVGAIDPGELEEVRRRLRELAAATGIKDVLIDARAASAFPRKTDFFFAVDRAARRKTGGRAALLVADPHRGTADFIALATNNRGIDLRVFTDETRALAWLAEGKANP